MSEILDIEQIGTMTNGAKGKGIALLKIFNLALTKNNQEYFNGSFFSKKEISFTVWGNQKEVFDALKRGDFVASESIVEITYLINDFGGKRSLNIIALENLSDELKECYKVSDFLPLRYDKEEYQNIIANQLLESMSDVLVVSEKCNDLLVEIVEYRSEDKNSIWNKFSEEFSAMTHHDNCVSGLMAHTIKMLSIYISLREIYPMFKDETTNDLMCMGIFLHDIGKVVEMHNGVYQPNSFVTHRILGLEIIGKIKEKIVSAYNEEFYYMLVSILVGHHGEYGDEARTIYAQFVHMIDNLDASFTGVEQNIENGLFVTNSVGKVVKFNGKNLNFL